MKKSFLFASIALLALATPGKAQISAYSFSQFNGNYGATNTGTTISNFVQNNSAQNLPFAFKFNGTFYNSFTVSPNGFISFTNPQPFELNPIQGNTQNVIAALGGELTMGTNIKGNVSAGSNIITNLSNTVGINVGDSINLFMSSGLGGDYSH